MTLTTHVVAANIHEIDGSRRCTRIRKLLQNSVRPVESAAWLHAAANTSSNSVVDLHLSWWLIAPKHARV